MTLLLVFSALTLLPWSGRRLSALALVAAVALSCSSPRGNNPTRDAIARQLELYPETRVQDIYKSFCQDAFGPGHLIPDKDGARRYLESELETYRNEIASGNFYRPRQPFAPTGDEGRFIRVDLGVVLDGLVDKEEYLDAFVESANEVLSPTPEQWKEKWQGIKKVILEDFPDIPDAKEDIMEIDSYVAQGNFILHHSRIYNRAYLPHYRIIAREKVEEWKDRF